MRDLARAMSEQVDDLAEKLIERNAKIASLQAKVARLEEALRQIVAVRLDTAPYMRDKAEGHARVVMREIARAALASPEQEPG